jgi:predicted aconitase
MRLTDHEQSTLSGGEGEAARLAMQILVDMGEIFGADALMPVSQVHIDMTLYMVDAGVEFVERLAELGGRFTVPTQLNPAAVDLRRCRELRVPAELEEKSRRLERAYLQMGALPTWTCAPYQQGLVPGFGEQIAWGESNAIAFANSVIGARTNRYADLVDVCAGIIGRVPRFGLHLNENRSAEMLLTLEGFSEEMFACSGLYPLLGYVFGELAVDRVAALAGMPAEVSMDDLKAFSAAAASSGAVGLFHLVGITPEAPSLEECFPGGVPVPVVLTPRMLADAEQRLSDCTVARPDLVAFGCPHFSVDEFTSLCALLQGRVVHESVSCWAFTSRAVLGQLEERGLLDRLKSAGVAVFSDGCPLQYPVQSWDFRAAMCNSAKFANYCYSQTGLRVLYGSLRECVETAVNGRVCREAGLWRRN